MKKRQQHQHQKDRDHHQKQIMQCNKGKTCRFKRSFCNGNEDGVSSAILLLACIACAPFS
ncbi:hypothetical protein GIB67_009263 [Kingdonia uniflora]|uniref:Uncharacterized protein n=1 Tax=Kingdonia uniflora TaxID=39325 RepID=A0A7J7N2V1_9MAGN|nr:hypothetical protein GIB67_009263 [Kingdonia uniflora]